jgi:hypothetical protein
VETPQEVDRSAEGPAYTRALPVLSLTVRRRLPIVIAVLAMAVVTGCTTATAGTPHAASSDVSSTDPSGTDDDLPSDGAPKVENPLDVSHFEEHPCDALKAEDAQTLNVPAEGKQTETGHVIFRGCTWINTKTGGALDINFFLTDRRGLSSVYREAKGMPFPYFEPIEPIEGYPAAAYNTKEKDPTAECLVGVGVSDQVSFSVGVAVSFDNIEKKDPCDAAVGATGMLLRTMKEAA